MNTCFAKINKDNTALVLLSNLDMNMCKVYQVHLSCKKCKFGHQNTTPHKGEYNGGVSLLSFVYRDEI